ncbi:MAG: hypothetical protein IH991_15965 [Planctomycetes bacterium]|nr:hypothetical protein [Planctomycetota bacterium]
MAVSKRNDTVHLGCGTLILIALIVLFFSQGESDDLKDEVRQVGTELQQLRTAVGTLKYQVEKQTEEIKSLRESLREKENIENQTVH